MAKSKTPGVARKRMPRWLKRLIVAIVVLGVLGGLGYAVLRISSGPSEGTITNDMTADSSKPTMPPVQYEQFDGKYVSFTHTNVYQEQTAKGDDPNSLESHTFVASGLTHKILSIIVTPLPSGKLVDDPAYYMRSLHPDQYKITNMIVSGEKVALVESAVEEQRAAFWVHGGKLLTFTLSSVSVDAKATAAEYQAMLTSVTWR